MTGLSPHSHIKTSVRNLTMQLMIHELQLPLRLLSMSNSMKINTTRSPPPWHDGLSTKRPEKCIRASPLFSPRQQTFPVLCTNAATTPHVAPVHSRPDIARLRPVKTGTGSSVHRSRTLDRQPCSRVVQWKGPHDLRGALPCRAHMEMFEFEFLAVLSQLEPCVCPLHGDCLGGGAWLHGQKKH